MTLFLPPSVLSQVAKTATIFQAHRGNLFRERRKEKSKAKRNYLRDLNIIGIIFFGMYICVLKQCSLL